MPTELIFEIRKFYTLGFPVHLVVCFNLLLFSSTSGEGHSGSSSSPAMSRSSNTMCCYRGRQLTRTCSGSSTFKVLGVGVNIQLLFKNQFVFTFRVFLAMVSVRLVSQDVLGFSSEVVLKDGCSLAL